MPAINGTNTLLNTTMSNQSQIVNYALNGKLLDNGADNGLTVVGAVPSQGASSVSLPLILILIFVLASIVGVIVTALFVMRRRFSTWRLDSSKTETKNQDLEDGITKKPDATDSPTETKETVTTTETEAPTVNTKLNTENEQSTEQLSPSSNSPLINEAEKLTETTNKEQTETEPAKKEVTESEQSNVPATESTTEEKETIEEVQRVPEQITSSSSLIVNVLNELSESVATKLACEINNADPEKEPLKNE